jgi:hypothetical protein
MTHSGMTKEEVKKDSIIKLENSIGIDVINKIKKLYLKYK